MADVKHHHFKSLSSTQNRARELLDAGEAPPFLLTANQQTQGRGRWGRDWISPPGNFFGSLVVRPAVPPMRYGEYSFLAAIALRETIAYFSPKAITLKWPNDALLDGRKCAGILIESHGAQRLVPDQWSGTAGNEFLIIGMGVNLRHAPPDDAVRTPAAALWPDTEIDAEVGAERDAAFMENLIENFTHWHKHYAQHGFEMIRIEWLSHAHGLGQIITARAPQGAHTGIFSGIDADGNLLLTQGDQIIKVTTADVSI